MNKKQIAITLGIMCLILTMTIVIQIKAANNANKLVSPSFSNNDLRNQVLKWKEKYDSTYATLQSAEKKLESVKEEQLKKNNILLGLTDVTGEGIIVTIKDNNNVSTDSTIIDPSYYLVHYGYLLKIVNELKNAGAEAISINDQRLVSTSSITCDGNVISVNGEKISSPFIIKAIGNASFMNSALSRPGGTVEYYNSYTPTSIKQSNNVTIKKYTGVINSKYIQYAE